MNDEKKDGNVWILTFIAVLVLVVMIVGATYSYFQAQGGESSSAEVTVTSATTDSVSLETGDPIAISANQTNFAKGKISITGTTTATATLKARSDASSTHNYEISIIIDTNTFTYTTAAKSPELLLQITAPSSVTYTVPTELGSKVSISDSAGDTYSGYDITSKTGTITLVSNMALTAEKGGTVTHDWSFDVIFINLTSDQENNTGKEFNGSIKIEQI